VVRAKKLATAARAKLTERRTKLKPADIDKQDVASATVRAQIRDRIVKMTPGERKAYLTMGQLDQMTCAAILEAPISLTDITAEQRDAVHAQAVEHANPGALAAVEKHSEAVQLLENSAKVLSEHAAELLDLPPNAMDDFLAGAIPDQRHLEADAARIASAIAA